MQHFDVIVVGAGLSGIGAGVHLQKRCPGKSYTILEARDAIGGTWDLFRYPGIRSDSDMHTLGYSFRPWRESKAIADGPSIRRYVCDTAREHGIDRHIRFRHRLRHASWSSRDARWTLEIERGSQGDREQMSCGFLFLCSGYYSYAQGYQPRFPGQETFRGRTVHPQFWPEDLDYAGKQIVVIGSGATAVTLVPELARTAAHVTMLQRSPTYMVSRPSEDTGANWLRAHLPERLAYGLTRWRNVTLQQLFFRLARSRPGWVRRQLLERVRQELGEAYDVSTHFTPRYDPWDQRICLVPDADLFAALRAQRASVITDAIETWTETGIRLKSGRELPADLIVCATGLRMEIGGSASFAVDGTPVDFSKAMVYKGGCISDVPNLAFAFGYTNASWTLKCDLICEYVCRLLKHMDRTGTDICVAPSDPEAEEIPFLDFSSGYVQRARGILPRQGARKPWRLNQNYALDLIAMRWGRIEDGVMRFSRVDGAAATARPARAPASPARSPASSSPASPTTARSS